MDKLSAKQRAFVAYYVQSWNGADAARRAGYSAHTAREQASRLLTDVNVKAAISACLSELAMSADETLARIAQVARSSIADVLSLPDVDDDPISGRDRWELDLVKAQQTGAIRLIRKIEQTDHGPRVELYSALDALKLIATHHGLLKERVEQSGDVNIHVEYADDHDPDQTAAPSAAADT